MKRYSLKLLIIFLIAFPFLIAMIIVYCYFILNASKGCYGTRAVAVFSQPYEDRRTAYPRYICTGTIKDKETVILSDDCIFPYETPDSLTVTSGSKYLLKNVNYHSVRSVRFHDDFAEIKVVPVIPPCVIKGIKSLKERSSNLILQGWPEDCKTTDCVLIESSNMAMEGGNIPGGLILNETGHVVGMKKKYRHEKDKNVVTKENTDENNDKVKRSKRKEGEGDKTMAPRFEF